MTPMTATERGRAKRIRDRAAGLVKVEVNVPAKYKHLVVYVARILRKPMFLQKHRLLRQLAIHMDPQAHP